MIVDYLAMLKEEKAFVRELPKLPKGGNALVGELPKLPKGAFGSKDSARTNENPQNGPDAFSRWRLPDGREVCTSPPETRDQVQARHPGAEPVLDTVTGPDIEAEARAIAYAEQVAKEREAGRVPISYTATTTCRHCGFVPIFAGTPSRVDLCPWCGPLSRGVKIPRPEVACVDCRHFTPDAHGHGGIGSCAKGGPESGQMPCYPHARRRCGQFRPKEGLTHG